MSVKQKIKIPDYEADQQGLMKNMNNIQSLADQVEKLEGYASDIEMAEKKLKDLKEKQKYISSEVIPDMMSEMGLAELKLHDGSRLKVSVD